MSVNKFYDLAYAYGLKKDLAAKVIDSYDWDFAAFDNTDIIEDLEKRRDISKPVTQEAISKECALIFGEKDVFQIETYKMFRSSGLGIGQALKKCSLELEKYREEKEIIKEKKYMGILVAGLIAAGCVLTGLKRVNSTAAEKEKQNMPALKDVIHQPVSQNVSKQSVYVKSAKRQENGRND